MNPADEPGSMNYIDISPKSFRVGTDPTATLKKLLADTSTMYSEISPITVDGLEGVQAIIIPETKGSTEFPPAKYVNILIPAPGPNAWTTSGQVIYSYYIVAYTYNEDLQSALDSVLESIQFKTP